MSHDPKLKTAMAEIFAVLKKHDIAGSIILASQSHSECRVKVDASWSCAFFEGRGTIRFRAKKSDIPDEAKRIKMAEETTHIFCQFRDLAGQLYRTSDLIIKQLEQHMTIDHQPGMGFEPHNEQ